MAVNLKDDYEKLAKLLYPSIEASGNVYYGTTRKLTMDALLDTTDIGFESCTANDRFEWKLGPLHSFIRISSIEDNIVSADTFGWYNVYRIYQDGSIDSEPITGTAPIYGTFFAKYILAVDTSNTVSNLTNAGDFTTYEYNVRFISASNGNVHGIYVTDDFDPANPTGYNIYDIQDRHFFITKEEDQIVLYVKVAHCEESESDYKSQPITFTHKRLGNITSSTVTLNCHGNYGDSYQCQYRQLSQVGGNFQWSNWQNYTINTPITLYNNEQVQFRSNGDAPQQEDSNDYLYFTTSGRLEVSGNVMSLLDDCFNDGPAHDSITWYKNGLPWLFSECVDIINAENLILPSELEATASYLYTGSYYGMFNGCTSLKLPPKILPATILTNNVAAYGYMFFNCTSLVKAPRILAADLSEMCFSHMFSGCTSLSDGGDILPATSLADNCYHRMFYNCQSLERSPKLPATTLGNTEYAYAEMFLSCSALSSVYCNLVDSSSTVAIGEQDFLLYTASNGTLYINSKSDWTSSQVLPSGWSLQNNPCDEVTETVGNYINFISDYNTRFTVDARNAFNESNYLVITGFDSELNGRGYLTDDTLYNMEQFFDENNIHYTNEYNQDGSYNQEIWGYKSFNSPVQFRNGIYTDSMSVTSPQAYHSTFSFIDHNGQLDDAEFDKYSSFSISTLKINEDICPISKNIAFSAYSVPYEIYDTTIHDYIERIDYISKDALVSALSSNETNQVISTDAETGMFSSVSTCAITKLLPEHPCIDPEPFRDSIKRYKSNMTAGESFIEVVADYSDENTLQNSSVNVMLTPHNQAQQLCGVTMSDIEFNNTTTDTSFAGKDIAIINSRNFLDNSFYDNYKYAYMWSGNIIEQYSGVFNDDSNDLEYNTSSTIIKSKEYGGPGTNLVESTIETNSSYDVSSSVLLESTSNTTSNSGNYIGNAKITLSSLLAATSGGTIITPPPVTIKLTSEVKDNNDVSTKSEFKVSPDGCSIDEVPIVPKLRSFTGSPLFTKGSVHILVVTDFGQCIKIGCGSIISSGTYQGNSVWYTGNHAVPGAIISLGKLCISSAGAITVESVLPGYPNESMKFKVLNCRNASDTDKSLIVISMTDQSNANV